MTKQNQTPVVQQQPEQESSLLENIFKITVGAVIIGGLGYAAYKFLGSDTVEEVVDTASME